MEEAAGASNWLQLRQLFRVSKCNFYYVRRANRWPFSLNTTSSAISQPEVNMRPETRSSGGRRPDTASFQPSLIVPAL
jgi:hypothetical protein